VQDQGVLFVALVNLYKALGGGWIEQAEQMSSAPAKLAASPPPDS
jgi:multidrug efflux system outer membrane protein